MKNILQISALLLLFCTINACKKEFVIDTDDADKHIVINAIFNQKDSLAVSITNSFNPYNNLTIKELNEARVSVYKNAAFVEELIYSKRRSDIVGLFRGSFIPEKDAEYELKVNDPNLGEATVKDKIPTNYPTINNAIATAEVWQPNSGGGGKRFNFSFELNDPPTKNYYYLRLYFPAYLRDTVTMERRFYGKQIVEMLTTTLPEAQQYIENGYLFEDDNVGSTLLISGEAKTSVTFVGKNESGIAKLENEVTEIDFSELFIHLQTLSDATHNFYNSHSSILISSNDIFAEPSTIYSNVNNGLGIFGAVYLTEIGMEVE